MSQTLQSKASKLREELRVARQSNSDFSSTEPESGSAYTTGGDIDGVSEEYHRPERSVFKDLSGSDNQNERTDGSYHDTKRSTDKESIRQRRADRRSSADNSGGSDYSEADTTATGRVRRRGRLIADDPIPSRSEEKAVESKSVPLSDAQKSRGRPRKKSEATSVNFQSRKTTTETGKILRDESSETGEKQRGVSNDNPKLSLPKLSKPSWMSEGEKLTETEVKLLEQPLIQALKDDLGYVDEFIWYQTPSQPHDPIWSDVDEEDCSALAHILLKQGQKSAVAATTVRSIVEGSDYISALYITVPRTIKMVDRYRKEPKKPKGPSFLERRKMQYEAKHQR